MLDLPLYAKAIIVALITATVVTAFAAMHHKIYAQGEAHGIELQKALDQKALAHNVIVYNVTSAGINQIEASAAPAASAAQAHTVVVVKTVEKIVHENPTFGAVVRPAALGSLRADQIARLRALAGPGAPPAAPSSSP